MVGLFIFLSKNNIYMSRCEVLYEEQSNKAYIILSWYF